MPWSEVIEAALEVRDRLEELGLQSFVKTTGGKGLHVVRPLEPQRRLGRGQGLHPVARRGDGQGQPDRYVADMSKRSRRGRIFVDYLRNGRGATAVAAYSTRALPRRAGLDAARLGRALRGIRADHFRVDNVRQSPWRLLSPEARLPVGSSYSQPKQKLPQSSFEPFACRSRA